MSSEADLDQLKAAIADAVEALGGSVRTLVRPPVRPWRIPFDKEGLAATLEPSRSASERVVDRFAEAAGVDEQTARSTVQPLLRQIFGFTFISWEPPASADGARSEPSSGTREAPGRKERLESAAVDALVRLYVDGRTDDEDLAETQVAWRAYEKQRRIPFSRRKRAAAYERYAASWARWAAAREA